jgi:DNA-binding response OmpR family regulator
MARILVAEPHPDLRMLLETIVRRAGHEPVSFGELNGHSLDLLILEPASPYHVEEAVRLRQRLRDLPIICTSILPPSDETRALEPSVYLVKPFRLCELERAIIFALAPDG